MAHLAYIADLVLNQPLLIHPGKLSIIASFLENRIGIDASELPIDPNASRFVGAHRASPAGGMKPYRMDAGVAIVTITGSLVNRGAQLNPTSGLMSYEAVKHMVASAAADPDVTGILLDMESPGGQATGAFETADVVRQAAAAKPVTAVLNGMAASAAYAIASAASRIVTTSSGIAGSIGVVLLHADYSRALDRIGVKPTLIHAGARKVDGNPYEALSEAVRADLQAQVDQLQTMFVTAVGLGRGSRLDARAARATDARIFTGADAVKAGLADAVGSFESALAELTSGKALRRTGVTTTPPTRGTTMSTDHIISAERERLAGILNCPEAKGREKSAMHIATTTKMSVDEARGFLTTCGTEPAGSAGRARSSPLGLVMSREGGMNGRSLDAQSIYDRRAATSPDHGAIFGRLAKAENRS